MPIIRVKEKETKGIFGKLFGGAEDDLDATETQEVGFFKGTVDVYQEESKK